MTFGELKRRANENILARNKKTCISIGTPLGGASLEKINSLFNKLEGDAEVYPVGCLGWANIEPAMSVAKPGKPVIIYGNITEESVETIISEYIKGDNPRPDLAVGKIGSDMLQDIPELFDLPFFKGQQRAALRNCGLINPEDIDDYIAAGGYSAFERALGMEPDRLIREIGRTGVSENGGHEETLENKWLRYRGAEAAEKIVVCNAASRDTEDYGLRLILESDPHTVLEGLLIAGYAIGASKGYIYTNQKNTLAVSRIKLAISQMTQAGLLGEGILGSGFSFAIEIKTCGDEIINREETAVVRGLSGELAMPFVIVNDPPVVDIDGAPVCVNSAELLAKLPALLTETECNTEAHTKVMSLSGGFNHTGVAELSCRTPLKDIVYSVGGGVQDAKELKSVFVGGMTGGFVSDLDISLSREQLKKAGVIDEAGVMKVYDSNQCIVWETKDILKRAQRESCGKCVTCREGTYQLQRILSDITEGKAKADDIGLMEEICNGMSMISICGYGKAAANTVRTSLKHFSDEFDAHISKKRCPALVCKKYVTYHILGEKCMGCGKCLDVCPADAILGEEGLIHVIDPYDCNKCGKCVEVCPSEYGAVVRAGLIKPRTPEEPIPVGSWRRR